MSLSNSLFMAFMNNVLIFNYLIYSITQKMDFRTRLLKENKQGSKSFFKSPKNLDYYTPKSLENQTTQKVKQLSSILNSLAQSQKVENKHTSELYSKIGLGLAHLQSRMANIQKICSISSHTSLNDKQEITSLRSKETPLKQDTAKSRINLLPQARGTHSEEGYFFTNLLPNNKFTVSDAQSKTVESLRTQFEGKLKALADRILLDFNIKSQFSNKQKQEQEQANLAQFQKKLSDSNSKMKKDIQHQILRKINKTVEEETEKMEKKIDLNISNTKKQILKDIEKDRCACLEQVNKVRVELDGKIKARYERGQYNPKKEAEYKKKQVELKIKLNQFQKKMNEMNARVKYDIQAQINQYKSKNDQSMMKLKGEWKLEINNVRSHLEVMTRDTASQTLKISSQLEQLTNLAKDKQNSKQAQHVLKQQLKRQIQIIGDRLNIMHKNLEQKINKQAVDWHQAQSSISSQLSATNEVLHKLQLRLFAQSQQNKSVYQKMSSDLLQITDSITLILTQMKPYRQ